MTQTLTIVGFAVVLLLGLALAGWLFGYAWARLSAATRIAVVVIGRGAGVRRLRRAIRSADESTAALKADVDYWYIRAHWYRAKLNRARIYPGHPPEGMTRGEAYRMEQRSIGETYGPVDDD